MKKLCLCMLLCGASLSWGATTNVMATRQWVTTNFASLSLSISNAITITNLQSFGCYNYSAEATLTNSTTATNAQIVTWNYSNSFAGIILTNGGFRNTQSGYFMVAFGSSILSDATDTSIISVRTNDVEATSVKLLTLMGASPATETGFKQTVLQLPTNCYVTLMASNNAVSALRLQNIAFTIQQLR